MCICLGSWDKRQNPDQDHGHPFRGWHAGYSPRVCQKLWQVIVHWHLCKYLHRVLNVIQNKPLPHEQFKQLLIFLNESVIYVFLFGFYLQGDTSGDYKKLLLKFCGGSDWKGKSVSVSDLRCYMHYTQVLHALPILSMQCLPNFYWAHFCYTYAFLYTSNF